MSDYILITSGFIIPQNNLFSPLIESEGYREALLRKESVIELFPKLDRLIDTGQLHSSAVVTEAYMDYLAQPNFDNYIRLVDIFTGVIGQLTLYEFVQLQLNNPYLSPTGFKLCLDMLHPYKFTDSYTDYAAVPSFFTMAAEVNSAEIATRQSRYDKLLNSHGYCVSYNSPAGHNLLTELVSHQNGFLALFKYMLTDFNRGNKHV